VSPNFDAESQNAEKNQGIIRNGTKNLPPGNNNQGGATKERNIISKEYP